MFPWDPRADPREPGGPLWFPRRLQGTGRHDAPDLYGAMYLCESPAACVAEALLPFRGRPFRPAMLRRGGRPLGLCRYRLAPRARLVDLDDPGVLVELGLRPSEVATRDRARTQAQARRLHAERNSAAGLRWWSPVEASWINVTLFQDRAEPHLSAGPLRELGPGDPAVAEAIRALGL